MQLGGSGSWAIAREPYHKERLVANQLALSGSAQRCLEGEGSKLTLHIGEKVMMRSRLLAITGLVSFALATSALAVAQSSDTLSPKGTALSATKTQIKSTGTKPTHHQSPPPPGAVRPTGTVTTPASSNKTAKGFAHTNIEIFVPKGQPSIAIPGPAVPVSQFVETPASLGCVYNVGPLYAGCNPATGRTNHPTGGWGAIALVDAFDNPSAGPDLVFFSKSMGLAPIILDPYAGANFHKVSADTRWGDPLGLGWTASCSTGVGYPPPDPGWGLEEDLDIEYAHAMAPSATILLVEACSNSYQDLFFAEIVAQILIEDYYPGGDISNSWAGGEDPAQLGDFSLLPGAGWDNVFYRFAPPNTTFFASAGDFGWGAAYPSTNPWIISAGGTSVCGQIQPVASRAARNILGEPVQRAMQQRHGLQRVVITLRGQRPIARQWNRGQNIRCGHGMRRVRQGVHHNQPAVQQSVQPRGHAGGVGIHSANNGNALCPRKSHPAHRGC